MKILSRFFQAGLALAISCMLVSCLGGGGSSGSTSVTPPPPATPTLTLFSGNMGGDGSNDGPAATAHFYSPWSVATDNSGNIFVADTANRTIRKITPDGVVSTLAGMPGVSGSADGIGAAAGFNFPEGIAVDSTGNVYVADSGNHTIRKITPDGMVTTLAGMAGVSGSSDGPGAAASFNNPFDVATDSAGNVYVADSGNNAIRKITPAGMVSIWAGNPGLVGSINGVGTSARFSNPYGIATDNAGNVYVADSGNNAIRKIAPNREVTTLAGTPGFYHGSADGIGAAASFYNPLDVTTDSAGNVYVADSGNHAIRKITQDAEVSTLAASFLYPSGVATDSAGNVYVTDSASGPGPSFVALPVTPHSTIHKISPAGVVSILAGSSYSPGSADGAGAAASFADPFGVAGDSVGNVYVADYLNNTIRKITPAGAVTTMAGTPGVTGSADGTGAAARFSFPTGVATDSTGNVYVADSGNNTIRKITPAGVVGTLAGKPGVVGSADGVGAAASFNEPTGIATDSAGNIYVADQFNRTIRKITPAGVVTTLAGVPGVIGNADGAGAAATFRFPTSVATDSVGNVYVTDAGHVSHYFLISTIRKITPAGVVTTLAGTPGGIGSIDGIGAAASFYNPLDVTTDSAGNVYVADSGNHAIRKITPTGEVSTVVGVAGIIGFSPGPLPGTLSSPKGVAISGTSLYITTYNGVAVVNNVP